MRAGALALSTCVALATPGRAAAQSELEWPSAMDRLGLLYEAIRPADERSFETFLCGVEDARAAWPDPGSMQRSMTVVVHARGLAITGRTAEAEAVLRRDLAESSRPNRWRAHVLLDLAELCSARQESAVVLALADQAEDVLVDAPRLGLDREFELSLLRVRCQTWIDLGRQDRAADLAERLAVLAEHLPTDLRQTALLQRGHALLALSAWEPLEALAREELAEPDVPPELEARWRLRLGQALSEMAHTDASRAPEARLSIRTAVDSGFLTPDENDAAVLALAELEIRAGDLDAAAELLGGLATARDVAVDLQVRLRAYFESLAIELALAAGEERERLSALRERAHATLTALRADWRARPTVPGGQGFLLFGEARLLLGQLARLEIALEGEAVGVERAIGALATLQGAGTTARTLGLDDVDAARLRSDVLGDDASLLVIVPNALRTHVFVLGPRTAVASEGAPIERIETLRGVHTSRLLTAPPPDRTSRDSDLAVSAAKLRDALFDGRVIAELRARPVVVEVGSDLLGGLPIESLDLGGGRVFGLEAGVAHEPSLPLAVALGARELSFTPGPWDAIAFGAPEHSSSVRLRWPRLAPVPVDASGLRDLCVGFAASRVRVVHGADAELAALATGDVRGARVLHILTHGVYDAKREEPAGLVVSSDSAARGVAWHSDLRALAAPPVVALWACGTERGPTRYGDDTAGHLGAAFLQANACSVVVSRADVALVPMLRMAKRFSRELARGAAQVEALRAAREEVANDPLTADPFFHASVVLYGHPGRRAAARPGAGGPSVALEAAPDTAAGPGTISVVAAIVLALSAIGWALLRARSRRNAG